MTAIFPGYCPTCAGDLQFARGLDGFTLKCLQCTRQVTPDQAKQILTQLRRRTAAVAEAQKVA